MLAHQSKISSLKSKYKNSTSGFDVKNRKAHGLNSIFYKSHTSRSVQMLRRCVAIVFLLTCKMAFLFYIIQTPKKIACVADLCTILFENMHRFDDDFIYI